jgi:hypothetical protein
MILHDILIFLSLIAFIVLDEVSNTFYRGAYYTFLKTIALGGTNLLFFKEVCWFSMWNISDSTEPLFG